MIGSFLTRGLVFLVLDCCRQAEKRGKAHLTASGGSTYVLQRKLVQTALAEDSSGGVQSSFTYVTPTSGVSQDFSGYVDCYKENWRYFHFMISGLGLLQTSREERKADLTASGGSTYELQRKLVQTALAEDSSGGVQSSFTYVTPTSDVFQVIIGGGSFIGGGAAAVEAPTAEEMKEEEEESDNDMGFSLFD